MSTYQEHQPRHARLDGDAVLDAMQDQIDDLTAMIAAQQKQLTRQRLLIARMSTYLGLPVGRTWRR